CKWENNTGAWYCTNWVGNYPTSFVSPLGNHDTTYFQFPETAAGPFANGAKAQKGHYWIRGNTAYKQLPTNRNNLGNRGKRSVEVDIGGTQKWGENDWPPERIIKHYGPATWNPNEPISGAREPIYKLNCIIRLQAILEIVTNKTALAIDFLCQQSQQMRTAIIQHRMVLDYLLAEEGGVCGKLNDSNCCLEIDDVGEVVLQLTTDIRRLVHVPVQSWSGWNGDLWSWLPGGPWVKQLLFYLLCAFAAFMFLPCIIPFFT
ncbi:ENR1 protein, partial [Nothoprocta ornata]|nr:ENR1 protein [Nothoprocta ornata]